MTFANPRTDRMADADHVIEGVALLGQKLRGEPAPTRRSASDGELVGVAHELRTNERSGLAVARLSLVAVSDPRCAALGVDEADMRDLSL